MSGLWATVVGVLLVLPGAAHTVCAESNRFKTLLDQRPHALFSFQTPACVGTGAAVSNPVIIAGVRCEEVGILVQKQWLRDRGMLPVVRQDLVSLDDRVFDVVSYGSDSTSLDEVWFDITSFFDHSACGHWVFSDQNGTHSNSIDTAALPRDYWVTQLPSPDGHLVYQLAQGIGEGYLAVGEILNFQRSGKWVWYGQAGDVQEAEYLGGKKHGADVLWRPDGSLWISTSWEHGKEHGIRKQVLENGDIWIESFQHGQRNGFTAAFRSDGTKKAEQLFKNGVRFDNPVGTVENGATRPVR